MFSSIGTRAESAIGSSQVDELQRRPICPPPSIAVEGAGDRPLRRQALEDRDVGDRRLRREVVAIGRREGAPVALAESAIGAGRLVARRERGREAVVPVADDLARPLPRASPGRDPASRPPARPMMKWTRASDAFREGRVEGRDVPVEGARRGSRRSASADVAVVAVARHEDDDRDEAVELVAPGEDAHARPLVERQDGDARNRRACPRRSGTARRADRSRAR